MTPREAGWGVLPEGLVSGGTQNPTLEAESLSLLGLYRSFPATRFDLSWTENGVGTQQLPELAE